MIIFGTRGVKSTIKEGKFHCPQCASQQAYKHKKVTKFFTLYFIPLIPLGSAGEYVECQSCRGTFIPRVLQHQPQQTQDQFLAEYEKALKHSLVLMMLADGEIDDREKQVVLDVANKFSHNDMAMHDLEQYITEVQHQSEGVDTYLKRVAPMLNSHGKEVVIKCALTVAAADGHIDNSELQLLKEIALALEVTGAHLKGILAELAPQPQPSMN